MAFDLFDDCDCRCRQWLKARDVASAKIGSKLRRSGADLPRDVEVTIAQGGQKIPYA